MYSEIEKVSQRVWNLTKSNPASRVHSVLFQSLNYTKTAEHFIIESFQASTPEDIIIKSNLGFFLVLNLVVGHEGDDVQVKIFEGEKRG